MKLSVSLPAEDVAVLDEFARTSGLPSRSAAVRQAVQLLRQTNLEQDYADARLEWEGSGEDAVWEASSADGLTDAAR